MKFNDFEVMGKELTLLLTREYVKNLKKSETLSQTFLNLMAFSYQVNAKLLKPLLTPLNFWKNPKKIF